MPAQEIDPVLGFLQLLWQLNHALEVRSKRMRAAVGITGPQRFVLRLIGERPMISSGELAKLVRVHPSTTSGITRRLVAAGFVAEGADPSDGRRALYVLTKKGRQLNERRQGTVEEAVARALARLSHEDVVAARKTLTQLAETLEGPEPRARKR
ncbi:MAG: MarR family winged helix-turn-helix transcriptional regulator [Polyangiales bacterium]